MPTRLSHTEMWGTGGPEGGTGATYSSQSGQYNLADGSMPDVPVPTFKPIQS
jgi:hypothetical protein